MARERNREKGGEYLTRPLLPLPYHRIDAFSTEKKGPACSGSKHATDRGTAGGHAIYQEKKRSRWGFASLMQRRQNTRPSGVYADSQLTNEATKYKGLKKKPRPSLESPGKRSRGLANCGQAKHKQRSTEGDMNEWIPSR